MFHFVPTWGIKDEERMEKLLCVTPLPKIYLAWQTQKTVHLLVCVFQTKLDKAVNIFCRPPE